MIDSILEQLIKKYVDDVNRAYLMMFEGLNLKSREEMREYRRVHGQGEFYLNGTNKYTFHGRGCRFSNNELVIDWDFGYGDILCGLDPWKIFYYSRDNKITDEVRDGMQIKEAFDKLVANGTMMKKWDLYYFK